MATELRGSIILPAKKVLPRCKIHVKLLDTSYADAPARTVSKLSIDYTKEKYKQRVAFKIRVSEELDPKNDYRLSVHVDIDNDGELSVHDLMHDQSYPVYADAMEELQVQLKEVL